MRPHPAGSSVRRLVRLVGLLVLVLLGPPAAADESSYQDRPAGESVEDLSSALTRAAEEEERVPTLFPRLKRAIQHLPPFLGDTALVFNLRSFYLPLRTLEEREAHAFTLGGKLAYRSGWWRETAQIGLGFYTSHKITADDPLGLTGLLQPGERDFTVFGESFLRLRWRDLQATFYRQELDLPYVNKNDSRMAPNSFQGVVAKGIARGVPWVGRLDWVGGYLSDIRPRNDEDFIPMSQQAGARGSDEGLFLGGLQFRLAQDFSLGLYQYFVPDTLLLTYLAGDYLWKLSADWGLRFQGQFTDQRSVGDEILPGGSFRTWVAGGRAAVSFRGVTAWLAFSDTDEDADIRSPFGSYAGYLSLMQSDFNRAGERAWAVGLSFAPRLWPRWSGFLQYASGDGGLEVATGRSNADEQEFDLTVDYKIDEGRWRGFWIRVRGSVLDRQGAAATAWQVRLILNYEIPIL